MSTKIDGKRQIQEKSIQFKHIDDNFLKSTTWVVADDNSAVITGIANPNNDYDAVNKKYVDDSIAQSEVEADNGLSKDSTSTPAKIELGGNLIKNTTVSLKQYSFKIDSGNGDSNNLLIDYNNKTASLNIQNSTLFDGAGWSVAGTYSQLQAKKDNGDNTSTVYFWKVSNDSTINSNSQTIKIKNDSYGITQINLENANSSDNYTGASFVATSSSTDYQDNTYLSHLGPKFYVTQYQNSGLLFSDQNLWIGVPYDNSKQINFVIGDKFDSPIIKTKIDESGLTVTNQNAIYYERAKTYSAQLSDITKLKKLLAQTDLGEVLPFDINTPERNIKRAYRTGSDYIGASQTLDFGIYFRKDTNRIRIYKNGTLLKYGTDYEWAPYPDMPTTSPNQLDYTTKIKLINYSADSNDKFILEYDEYILSDIFLDIRALAWNGNGVDYDVRPRMITKSISVNSRKYYLSDVVKKNSYTFECTYTYVNDPTQTWKITKKYYNGVYFPIKIPNSALPFEVELWRENKACSFNNKSNEYQRPPKYLGGHLTPVWRTNKNLIVFKEFGALRYRTNYFVRFRFTDEEGNTYFSNFQPYKISKRYFNIFTTNASFTSDTYNGVYETLSIVY